jgi:hypothetical protein
MEVVMRVPRRLFLLCALSVLVLPAPLGAEVLSSDAGFEWPVVADGDAADPTWTSDNSWSLSSSAGAPPVVVRRGAGAYRGGQFCEIPADGSNGHTQTLTQDLSDTFSSGMQLMLAVRLRAEGPRPASGGVVLRVLSGTDSLVAEKTVPYDSLEDRWRQHILWPAAPDDPGQVGETIRFRLTASAMGNDAGFSVYVDELRLETVEDDPTAWAPNHSFENLNEGSVPGDPARSALEDWEFHSTNASFVTVQADGGSHGPQYVSSAGHETGPHWYPAWLPDLDGSYLDAASRYELSGDARYSGEKPEGDNQIWLHLTPPEGDTRGTRNLIVRNKIEFWKLQDEFQTYRLAGDRPKHHLDADDINPAQYPEWNLGDDFRIAFSPQFPTNPGSAVEIDNLRFDRITPPEMFESDTVIILDTTRPVPSRFETAHPGSVRRPANSNPTYNFYLPVGLSIIKAGNDPDVAHEFIGNRSGNTSDIYYDMPDDHPEFMINGERYRLWQLLPFDVHGAKGSTRVGPIYFDTQLPAGTQASLYYETSWDAYTTQEEGDVPAGTSPLREVTVETKQFPDLPKPEHFPASISWIKASDQIFWPGYLQNLQTMGFNAVGGHQGYDGYALQGEQAPPKVVEFIEEAKEAEYQVFSNASPWNHCTGSACTIVMEGGIPVSLPGVPCPAYGLIDETPYGGDTSSYTEERDRLADWIKAVAPDYIQFDAEGFKRGAKIALGADPGDEDHPDYPDDPRYTECERCNDFLADLQLSVPSADMAYALRQMGVDRTLDLRNEILALGATELPEMAYYHTRPGGWVYHDVWDLGYLVDAGVVDFGVQPFYGTARATGSAFRSYQEDAIASGVDFIPGLKPAVLTPVGQTRETYDDVIELLGSGARGLIWWPYDFMVGGDFYYHAKALESIVPVEHLLTSSVPLSGVSGVIAEVPELPEARYAVEASAVQSGNHYFILVSSYGATVSPQYEDPYWVGDVDVTLPNAVIGTPSRLADRTVAGAKVEGGNVVRIHFEPGVPGARTALFHLCDNSVDSCDTDGDGLTDEEEMDTYGTDVFEPDSDGDGYNDGNEIDAGSDPNDDTSIPLVQLALDSIAAEDGWVRQKTEGGAVGGQSHATSVTDFALKVGDNQKDQQYKSLVSFDTSALPDGAEIVAATLELTRGGTNGDPFATLGICSVDIVAGAFGGDPTLENSDYEAPPDQQGIAEITDPGGSGDRYAIDLGAGVDSVNDTGRTQLRFSFAEPDDDDRSKDLAGFYSGEDVTRKARLVIDYHPAP